MPAAPVPVTFSVRQSPSTVLEVQGPDGRKYELKMAILVSGVVDQGTVNPIDGMPIFGVAAQVVTAIALVDNGSSS